MQDELLTILRNREIGTAEFRRISDILTRLIAADTFDALPWKRTRRVQTPVGTATAKGSTIDHDVMVVPVLRSGLALLGAFTEVIPDIAVGVVGLKRDEATAEAYRYYEHFPKRLPKRVVILAPMLATGRSALQVVQRLKKLGFRMDSIYFTGVLAAQDGYNALVEAGMSTSHITVVCIDPELNDEEYIVPGLGDYGDRYFGHEKPLSARELMRYLTGKHRALIPGILKATRKLRCGVSKKVLDTLRSAAREVYEKEEGIVVKAATLEGPPLRGHSPLRRGEGPFRKRRK